MPGTMLRAVHVKAHWIPLTTLWDKILKMRKLKHRRKTKQLPESPWLRNCMARTWILVMIPESILSSIVARFLSSILMEAILWYKEIGKWYTGIFKLQFDELIIMDSVVTCLWDVIITIIKIKYLKSICHLQSLWLNMMRIQMDRMWFLFSCPVVCLVR